MGAGEAGPSWLPVAVSAAISIASGLLGGIASYLVSSTRNDEQIKALIEALKEVKAVREREHKEIEARLDRLDAERERHEAESRERLDAFMRQIGEGLQAIRQDVQIHQAKNFDTFVRRDDNNASMSGLRIFIEASMREIGGKLDQLAWKSNRKD
jgi:transposase